MQSKSLLLSFLFIANTLFAQDIFLGANGTIGIISNTSLAGIGLGINGEYRFASYPFSLRLTGKVYNSEIDGVPTLVTYIHDLKTVELNLLYIPFKGMGQPYIGIGVGYNTIGIEAGGNAISYNGISIRSYNAQNTFNYNILLGAGLAAERTLSFFIELLFSSLKLKYNVEDYVGGPIMNKSVVLNKIYLSIGFKVRL
jgi:hypothetical protein